MDSKVVSREIKRRIWPVLRAAGFSKFSTRTAWRYSDVRVDVVNFQAMGAHLSALIKCPAHSFAINIGAYFTFIPPPTDEWAAEVSSGVPSPRESFCHLRRILEPDFPQPEFPSRNDFFFIDQDGALLDQKMREATRIVEERALPWFPRYDDLHELLRLFQDGDERRSEVWGFGCKESPIRLYYLGYTALRLGLRDLAQDALAKAGATKVFAHLASRIRADIARGLALP